MRRSREPDDLAAERHRMAVHQLARRGIADPAVLQAMEDVPREEFVPQNRRSLAYADGPLPIGHGQTISQPYVVALMIEAIAPAPHHRVLEIGTGSGYAAAVLSRTVAEVHTVERVGGLAADAAERCHRLGYTNVHVHAGDGTLGWPEHAPYDGILAAASGPRVPDPLRKQLAVGGRLVMPVGGRQWGQTLVRVHRVGEDEYREDDLGGVAFVPLLGAEGWPD